jgi:hypothetical protein
MNVLGDLYGDQRQMAGAVLTTFPFTAPYFEDVVWRAFGRKGIEMPVVLTDPETYASTLSADGGAMPTTVGRSYLLEPVVMEAGYRFHPKLFFFGSADRAYAYIGSANLTEQALTSNQEVVTRLEAASDDERDGPEASALRVCQSFLAQVIEDYGDEIGRTATRGITSVLAATDWLADSGTGNPDIDVLHSLSEPILPQLETLLAERNETVAAVEIAAPYYGAGLRIPDRFNARVGFVDCPVLVGHIAHLNHQHGNICSCPFKSHQVAVLHPLIISIGFHHIGYHIHSKLHHHHFNIQLLKLPCQLLPVPTHKANYRAPPQADVVHGYSVLTIQCKAIYIGRTLGCHLHPD